MVLRTPAPGVRACVDAVAEARCAQSPSDGLSTMPRAGLACGVTAVLVTHAICWARVARARLGSESLAALAWLLRHRQLPWDERWGARVRVLLCHDGLHSGSLAIDETDHNRSPSARTLAPRSTRRAQASGGAVWGQRLVWLVLVTPPIALPGGVACAPPAPERSAWDQQDQALKKPGVPTQQQPSHPPANPRSPTTPALAWSWLAQLKTPHPDGKVHWRTADALEGTAPCGDGASVMVGGVQVISPLRSHQNVRRPQPAPHVHDDVAAHPGPPHTIRLRGGQEMVALVGSARVDVCAPNTTRVVVALTAEGADTSRYLIASDLTWRTRARVPGQTLRWRVDVLIQDWQASDGWRQLTTQPGIAGARQRVILSLLVDQALFVHPDQHAQHTHHRPASTVGRLRAQVHGDCLVDVVTDLVASAAPQEPRHRSTHA